MAVDINKQYETRDGQKVRIYSTDASGPYPVHGAIFSSDREAWRISTWTNEGAAIKKHEDRLDLVEISPTHTNSQPKDMNLHDWFAGQALAGMDTDGYTLTGIQSLAQRAYDIADAMIAERQKRNKE